MAVYTTGCMDAHDFHIVLGNDFGGSVHRGGKDIQVRCGVGRRAYLDVRLYCWVRRFDNNRLGSSERYSRILSRLMRFRGHHLYWGADWVV